MAGGYSIGTITPHPAWRGKGTPSSNSTLINGKGHYPGGPAISLAVLKVEPFKRLTRKVGQGIFAPSPVSLHLD